MSEKLLIALTKMLRKPINGAEAQTEQLHGGTLGDVKLLTGTAQTAGGETLSFRHTVIGGDDSVTPRRRAGSLRKN